MSDASHSRTNIVSLFAISLLSSATMVWLFWHYPLVTTVLTVGILAGLGVCARLAQSTDTDMLDLQRSKPSI